jgi:hypothetical protein
VPQKETPWEKTSSKTVGFQQSAVGIPQCLHFLLDFNVFRLLNSDLPAQFILYFSSKGGNPMAKAG